MSKKNDSEDATKYESKSTEEYNSEEDLEQLVRISVSNGLSISSSRDDDYSKQQFSKNHLCKRLKFKTEDQKRNKKIFLLRLLNILSIIILLLTFFTTSISKMNNKNYNLLMEYLRRDKIQAESNMIVLYIAFFFVAMSLTATFLRNLIIIRDKEHSQIDIENVILLHYSHYYYLGNILFSLCLISNQIRILTRIGINCLLSIVTLIIYSKAYHSHKNRIDNIKLEGIFNYLAFSVNISFLLAWNVASITISIASFLSFFNIGILTINQISLILQGTLCLFVVLSLSYFHDLFFSFIILTFQIGNTLNKNIFNFNTLGKPEIDDSNNVSLVMAVFTAVCFVFSLIFFKNISSKKEQYMEHLEEMNKNYYQNEDRIL